ncbi:MAG: hypothetical protein IJD45_04080 [Clostridia bacterium]|nr:hypothetical protein [Clostridia bacterium]
MFKNIGSKIMKLAQIYCWIKIIISISVGLAMIILRYLFTYLSTLFLIYGILLIILGPLISWIGSFLLYGFGRLVENSDIISGRK